MKLTFYGGARSVTGANFMLEDGENKVLVDCGLHQGVKFCEDGSCMNFAYDPSEVKTLLVTHAHADHIGTNVEWGLPIWIHASDAPFLRDPELNLSAFFFESPVTSPSAERLLYDEESCLVHEMQFTVLHTPGHTLGSISLLFDDCVFTGDTLFCGGVGRTDFEYGDEDALFRSIRKKIMAFPDDTVIYPGHGDFSTIGKEKKFNPFLV